MYKYLRHFRDNMQFLASDLAWVRVQEEAKGVEVEEKAFVEEASEASK